MNLYDKSSLILVPGAVKDGKVYSQRPENGDGDFTFSRGSNLAATRVDENGLIEKGRENLILQSNQFDTTWFAVNGSATLTSGQSGYDGSNNAWELEKNAASVGIRQNISLSGVQTFSIYAKAGTLNWVAFENSGSYGWFDLVNGVAGTNTFGNVNFESIGNGWWRISVLDNLSNTRYTVYPAPSNDSLSGTSGSIYIQDAQLEKGLVATDYIETTTTTAQAGILEDMPRLDYTDASCPSLLLEPQRSNLVTQSEYFDSWTKTGSPTITTNYGASPDGLQNSTRIQAVSGERIYLPIGGSSSTYTYSIYAKGSGTLRIRDNSGTYYLEISPTSEWARYNYLFTDAFTNIQISFSATSDVEIYGAQVEAGSYATSYIPTYGTSQTRSGDSTNDLDTSLILTQSNSNTFFGEVVNYKNTGNTRFMSSFDSGRSNDDRILIYSGNGSILYMLHCQYKVTGQSLVQFNIATGVSYGDTIKFAVVFNGNEMIAFANGIKTATATIVDADNFNKFDITGSTDELGTYKQLLLFPTALTDSECIALTQL